jgi:transcription elongation factor Elf1
MTEKKPLTILACPRCGSKRIEMGTMNAGITFGVTSWKSVCKNCGYQGEPLIFDTEDAYDKFLEGLSQDQSQQISTENEGPIAKQPSESEADETAGLTAKDMEVVDYAHDVEKESARKEDHKIRAPVFDATKSWRVEVLVALVISAVWTVIYLSFYASRFFSEPNLLFMFLYSFFYFAASTLVILVVIIIIEYIYYRTKRVP